jgi:hypothetical protein
MSSAALFLHYMGQLTGCQVSKIEIMLLFMNGHETQNTPLVSSAATQSTDPPHLNDMQSPQQAAVAAHAPEARAPSPIAPSQQHEPASPFDGGVRASQLQEYCRCVRIWCAGSLKLTLCH